MWNHQFHIFDRCDFKRHIGISYSEKYFIQFNKKCTMCAGSFCISIIALRASHITLLFSYCKPSEPQTAPLSRPATCITLNYRLFVQPLPCNHFPHFRRSLSGERAIFSLPINLQCLGAIRNLCYRMLFCTRDHNNLSWPLELMFPRRLSLAYRSASVAPPHAHRLYVLLQPSSTRLGHKWQDSPHCSTTNEAG